MKLKPWCIPCLISVRTKEILNSNLPEKEKFVAVKEISRMVLELSNTETTVTYVASIVFKRVKELLGDSDPYREMKEEVNKAASILAGKVESELENEKPIEKLKKLIIYSVNANSLDPGVAGYSFSFKKLEKELEKENFGINDLNKAFNLLSKSKKIVYLLDNAGEAVFDKLVLKEIKKIFDVETVAVAKFNPYQNDVTVNELRKLGFGEVVNKVLPVNKDFSSIMNLNELNELKKEINESDLVISKGMANYETLPELKINKPILYLLKAKCKPVAESLKINVGENAAYLYLP